MTTEILSTEYVNGKRITNQKVTYSKCDDVNALGQLYTRLSEILCALENPNADMNISQYKSEQKKA